MLFFPRDNSLISRGNSHVSRVRGLVVRCLLFNPEVSCSNPWVCANFFTSIPKQKVLTFFGTMRLFGFVGIFFGFVRLFFEIFLMSRKSPPFNFFLIFCKRTNVKIRDTNCFSEQDTQLQLSHNLAKNCTHCRRANYIHRQVAAQ